jgi:hypothetical protein
MKGTPQIRQRDIMAASGGRFDSSRGSGGKSHGALDLNGKVGDPVFAAMDGKV